MTLEIKVNDVYKPSGAMWVKTGGAWNKVKEGYIKVDDVWRKFFVSELKDAFDRVDTTTGLGSTPTGQTWVTRRGTWQVQSNKAAVTTSKASYPLATVEVGISDFDLKANELTPGVGVAFRVEDANNWWGVVPWYDQVAYQYQECPVALVQEGYCIVDNQCSFSYCSGGLQAQQECTQGPCISRLPTYFVCDVPSCRDVTVRDPCYTYLETVRQCQNVCVKNCQSCKTVVIAGGKFGLPAITKQECSTVCCDRDTICTNEKVSKTVCPPAYTTEVCDGCASGHYEQGECDIYDIVCSTVYTCPGGYVSGVGPCGYPNCATTGFRNVCPQAEVTRTGYNYFYKLYLVQSINGTITVQEQFNVGKPFVAVRATGQGTTLAFEVFSDNAYATAIGSFTFANATTGFGTQTGVFGYPSNYQEGTTIGSLELKQYGG
jgi:hypothetical protein